MASCKQCIHKTVCAIYNDSLRETLERGGTMLCQCGEYLPAANVIEIKQGKWVKGKKEKLYYGYGMEGFYDYPVKCSKCQFDLTEYGYQETEYCPNCGAKMEGENNG